MKKYSSNRAQRGKTAYRTPSRWLAGQPEYFKKNFSNLNRKSSKYHQSLKNL
jgi:hypothetical protein